MSTLGSTKTRHHLTKRSKSVGLRTHRRSRSARSARSASHHHRKSKRTTRSVAKQASAPTPTIGDQVTPPDATTSKTDASVSENEDATQKKDADDTKKDGDDTKKDGDDAKKDKPKHHYKTIIFLLVVLLIGVVLIFSFSGTGLTLADKTTQGAEDKKDEEASKKSAMRPVNWKLFVAGLVAFLIVAGLSMYQP